MPTEEQLKLLRRAFWVALIPGAILFMAMQVVLYARAGMIGADSHAYWMAVRFPETWYTRQPAFRDAFLYSPAFGQVLWPLGQLPWPAFQALWAPCHAGVRSLLPLPLARARCSAAARASCIALFPPLAASGPRTRSKTAVKKLVTVTSFEVSMTAPG